jgi:hypothetical protein
VKYKLTAEKIFDMILLGISLYMVFQAFSFPFRAKLLPLLVGIPAVGMLFFIVIKGLFFNIEGKTKPLNKDESGRQKIIFIYLAILLGLLLMVGLAWGLALFLFFFLFFVGKQAWWLAGVMGIGMYVVIYVLFDLTLHYRLFQGYLLGLFL